MELVTKCITLDDTTDNFIREMSYKNRLSQSDVIRNALRLLSFYMDQYDITYIKDVPTFVRTKRGPKK